MKVVKPNLIAMQNVFTNNILQYFFAIIDGHLSYPHKSFLPTIATLPME